MEKVLYDKVDLFNPIEGKIQYFVEAFVNVYGEKYRNLIETRLNAGNYFFIPNIDSSLTSREIDLKIRELADIEIHKYLKSKHLPNIKIVLHGLYGPDDNFYEICKNDKEVFAAFSKILFKFKLLKLKDLKSKNKVLNFFKNKENCEKFYKILSELTSRVQNIKNEVYARHAKGMKLISENTERIANAKQPYDDKIFNLVKSQIEKICALNGKQVDESRMFEMASRYIDILKMGFNATNTLYYANHGTDKVFINFFESLGYDKKNASVAYLVDENIREQVFEIYNEYSSLVEERKNAICKADIFLSKIIEDIDNLLSNYDEYEKATFKDYLTLYYNNSINVDGYVQSYSKKDGSFGSYCICKNFLDLNIYTLIHELGHMIEVREATTESLQQGIGYWNVEQAGESESKYTIIEEAFNEYLSKRVVKEYEKIRGEECANISFNGCAYDPVAYVLKEFFEKYGEKLVEFKMEKFNLKEFINYFGKENLDELDKLSVKIFSKYGLQTKHESERSFLDAKRKVGKICDKISNHVKALDAER